MSVALELIESLDLDELLRISGFLDNKTLEKLINTIKTKDFKASKQIIEGVSNFDSRNFIKQLINILPKLNINHQNMNSILSYIGTIDYRVSQGGDKNIQLTSLIAEIIKNINN